MAGEVRRTSRWIRVMTAWLFLLAPLACTTTQTAGEQVSDGWISTKVKAKLTTERFSNITNIEVNVTNGVVTLAGEVPNEKVRAEAEAEVWQIEGVRRVINNLQVQGRLKDEPVSRASPRPGV